MKELDLVRLLEKIQADIAWCNGAEHLFTWIDFGEIERFANAVSDSLEDDGGKFCKLQTSGICIDLVPICDHFGIDPERILKRENSTT